MPATPIRYLTESDVLALLPSIEVQIGLVEGALRAVATGTAHQPPKVPLNLGAGAPFAHAMPAAIDLGSGRVAGAKWISGGGAAGIGGVVLVERPKAGGLRGIVAAGELTAARTAAVSGAGLRIAPPSTAASAEGAPYKGAIIGGGLQAATHRAVLAALHPAATVAFYSRRAAAELPLRAGDRVAESVNDAIRGADIIVFASPSAVESFLQQAASLRPDVGARQPKVVAVGPTTADAVRRAGIPLAATAAAPTPPAAGASGDEVAVPPRR